MLKELILVLLLVLCKVGFVVAQQFDWVRKVEIKHANQDPHIPQLPDWRMDAKIEADPSGNIFVTGHFKDTVVFGTQSLISKGEFDVFIAKYNSEGTVEWVKQIQGLKDQRVNDMDIDRDGNIYLTGEFSHDLTLAETVLAGTGAFVLKLNNEGQLTWAKKIESNQTIAPKRILATEFGEFFLAGSLYGTVDFGCSTLTSDEQSSKFIAHYTNAGDCLWANKFVASYLMGLAFDGYNLYITGGFLEDAIFGETTLTADFQDIYIAKCDVYGNWGWALRIGGAAEDQARDIEIDHSGNVITTGFFAGTVDFGNTTLTSTGANDIFVASYNQYGSNIWAQQAGGGAGNQYAFDIDADASEHVIITGSIIDVTDFGPTTLTPNGEKSFFATYDRHGNCLWALGSTGTSGDRGLDVTTSHDNIFVVGEFYTEGVCSFGQNDVHVNRYEIYISKIRNPSNRFTRIVPASAVGIQYSHNAWIDFDGDNDLDFLTTGANSTNDLHTILYENMGSDKFQPAPAPFNNLPRYSESEIAFLNLNNDNRIDFMFMGRRIGGANTNRISLVENNQNGFEDKGSLPNFGNADGYGTVSVGDVNNDGFEDIFVSGITGYNSGSPSLGAFLYYNQNGSFTKTTSSTFTGLYIAASRLADLDNDHDLDLIVCGSDNQYPYPNTLVYTNDGTGNFSLASIELTKLQNPSIDLFDIDGDNDLDVLITGLNEQLESVTKLYKNSMGSFTAVALPPAISRTASGSAKWGDYDNDGDADILITGKAGSSARTLSIFVNEDGQFTELIDPAFETLGIGYASWGDYDNDGDLDILASGMSYFDNEAVPTLYVLRNEVSTKNENPSSPGDFKITSTGSESCTLEWEASTDDLTPSASLTYNLSIQNMNTGDHLLHPFSENSSGKRMISEQGNVMLNKTWNVNGLDPGMYSIKVQAIDGGYKGSSWSEKIFYNGLLSTPSNLIANYQGGGIHLTWDDNSVNEQFFVIERKINDGEFLKYDSVSSNINSFVDATEDVGIYTYRIYAVNPTQKTGYSNTANVLITDVEYPIQTITYLYPNPATSTVTIKVGTQKVTSASVQIRNSTGMVIESKNVSFEEHGEAHIDLSALSSGIYFLELNSSVANSVMKLLKK